ncbi:hypothetical protein D3C80_2075680 [compost metagenome]
MLACPGRFDGSIEGEQIRLIGNFSDHFYNTTNLLILLIDFFHNLRGIRDDMINLVDFTG